MVLLNGIRVLVCGFWTAIVGTPLVVVIYARYAYAKARALLGRAGALDHVLEANAELAGWVAQKLWAGVLLAVAGVRLRVQEIWPIDWSSAHVICANHASLFDILALIRVVPPPFRFVAKRELVKWPIVGWALRPAGQIIVDRADHGAALRSIAEAALRHIRGQVIFFVEGTRTRTGELQAFKKGAFHFAVENRLPVLPTAIRGSYAALARLPWWRLRPGRTIEVRFCRPVECEGSASGEHRARVEALHAATRSAIVEGLA